MQKTLDLLERYVEWVALGLAGLILLWVAYAYVLTPITVKVGSRELTPGEVDAVVKREAADKLKSAMEDKTPVQFQVGDWRGQVARIFEATAPVSVPQYANATDTTGQPNKTTQPAVPVVEPVLAKAVYAAQSFGRGTVLWPDPNAKADPAKPNMPAGMAQKDVDWRSITWHVKMEDLDKAFDDAHLPADARMTQFFGRTLIRQEMQPNGQWGPDMVIPELPGEELTPVPADAPQPTPEQWAFIKWAQENAQLIMQPGFLQQVRLTGTMWYAPGSQPPPEEGVRPAVAVAPGYTPAPAPRGAGGSPSTPPPAGGGPRGAAPLPPPVQNNAGHRAGGAAAPFQYPNPGQGFKYPGYGGTQNHPTVPSGAAAPPAAGAPLQPIAPAGMANAGPLPGMGTPDGRFNPAEAQDFDLLTHDITVQPGKTYRYKVRYTLLNPAWNRADLSPALAKKFALTSPDSDWTSEVRVPQRVEFWIVKAYPNNRSASFDVFEWKGQWTKRTVTVSPGDSIGESSWMLVDVRDDGHQHAYALVADANAKTVRRDPRIDATDSKHLLLDGQVAPAGGNAAAGIVP
jgi:hypothetical protein